MAPALSLPVISKSVLPILAGLVSDQIPNIRFNVAKSYAVLIDVIKRLPDSDETLLSLEKAGTAPQTSISDKGDAVIREEILPNLDKLTTDEDVDVRYFATTAAKSYSDVMQT